MTRLEYHAAVYELDPNAYVCKILEYPGVQCEGRTIQSVRSSIRNALRVRIEHTIAAGKPLPLPDADAKDKKAVFSETVLVRIAAWAGTAR